MDRLIFLALVMLMSSCEPFPDNRDDGYVFHDDFYYESLAKDKKCYLTKCQDEYFIIIRDSHQEHVLTELGKQGFQITSGPTEKVFSNNSGYGVPDFLTDCKVLTVKGGGDIAEVKNLIYSNFLYLDALQQTVGFSNIFGVRYENEQQHQILVEYAKQCQVYPIANYSDLKWMTFACTNESIGNPVELANWLVEVGGFSIAQPDFSIVTLD